MNYVDLVIVLALLQYLVFTVMVGRARGRYGVSAPAVTGNDVFERFYRVQMNTLELLVMFVPALFVAGRYWPETYVAATGGVYLVGRVLFARAYISAPETRALGFLMSMLPTLGLMIAALVGVLMGTAA